MHIPVSKLTGAALDWAVAKCEGYFDIDMASVHEGVTDVFYFPRWQPSTDWAQGGLIIEREKLCVFAYKRPHPLNGEEIGWLAYPLGGMNAQFGSTPLIAAMRCYVMLKLVDQLDIDIEIPDDLLTGVNK
jgi:hypothetical protein